MALGTLLLFIAAACNRPKPASVPADLPSTPVTEVAPVIDTAAIIDSLMKLQVKLPAAFTHGDYNEEAAAEFNELALKTGGRFTLVRKAGEVASTASGIIRSHARSGTDVLFLIDRTGSMSDDIENIKTGMKRIVGELRKHSNVRCGMAFYGDKNVDGHWFNHLNFTADLNSIETRIADVRVSGGGDLPESVYDGFFMALKHMNFDTNRKAMVILIGDAPSLGKGLADHLVGDVIKACRNRKISINLYPMLLSLGDDAVKPVREETHHPILARVYPNPTRGLVNFNTTHEGKYEYQVISQAGTVVRSGSIYGSSGVVDLSAFSNGLYVIRLVDPVVATSSSQKIVLQR